MIAAALQLWLVAEFLFYFYYVFTKRNLEQRIFVSKPTPGDSKKILNRCLRAMMDSSCSTEQLREHKRKAVRGWFRSKSHDDDNFQIHKGNVREWIAWAFFESTEEELASVESDEVDEMIKSVEAWLQEDFPEGYNSTVVSLRLNLDPINSIHRPLIYYAVTAYCFEGMLRLILSSNGFSLCKSGASLSYWYRKGSKNKPSSTLPIVFCHGLGVGVLPYVQFIMDILKVDPGREVFLINLPNISMQPNTYVHSSETLVHDICKMLQAWSVDSAHFIGHSFGSCVMSYVLKSPEGRKRVAAATFIDPVTFLLCRPDVAYNFMYRRPSTATQLLIKYFLSQELYIAHSLSRHFFWKDCMLWEEQLTAPTNVILSKLDSIVPSERVHGYLTRVQPQTENLKEVVMFPDIGHAESFLVNTKRRLEILESVLRLERSVMIS